MSRAPVAGSTLVAAQRSVRLKTSRRALPAPISLPTQLNSAHGPAPSMMTLGRKRKGSIAAAHDALELAQRGEIDDVQALGRDVGKAVARRFHDARGASEIVLHVGGEELLDERAAGLCRQIALHDRLSRAQDGQRSCCFVEAAIERGEPLVAHQHQKADFGQMLRRGRIEAAGTVLDGPRAVEGHRFAGRERARICIRSGVRPLTG